MYLQMFSNILEKHPVLKEAMKKILNSPQGADLQQLPANILRDMGLVYQQENRFIMSCRLFTDYFGHALLPYKSVG